MKQHSDYKHRSCSQVLIYLVNKYLLTAIVCYALCWLVIKRAPCSIYNIVEETENKHSNKQANVSFQNVWGLYRNKQGLMREYWEEDSTLDWVVRQS